MKIPAFLFALVGLFLFGAIGSLRAPVEVEAEPQVPEIVFTAVSDDFPAHRGLIKPVKKGGPPPPPDNSLRVGSKGPEVLALEERLTQLTYMVGKVDGVFDAATRHGVIAFQKVQGMPRIGKVDDATKARLASAQRPIPAYATPADHLEVDIPKQIVLVVRGGQVSQTLPTSTGNNKLFTSEGWTRRAITPNGQFKITRKINGMRISPLGELYKPSYFNGGIAFHGNGSVPTYPASHGCVRLPMQFADWFFASASPVGMVVYVYGGPTGPNPQPYIDDKPASSTSPAPSPNPSPSPSPSGVPVPVPSSSPTPTPSPSPSPTS